METLNTVTEVYNNLKGKLPAFESVRLEDADMQELGALAVLIITEGAFTDVIVSISDVDVDEQNRFNIKYRAAHRLGGEYDAMALDVVVGDIVEFMVARTIMTEGTPTDD